MTRKWRAWLAAAGAVASLFTIHAATPAAASAGYTFFHFNMSGNMGHAGRLDHVVPAIVNSITDTWPSAVSLNEVCENQFARIHWDANVAGGGYAGHFRAFLPPDPPRPNDPSDYCDGHAYGIGLLVRGDRAGAGGFQEYELTVASAEDRAMVCTTTGVAGHPTRLKVCTAHLEAKNANPDNPDELVRYQQMREVSKVITTWAENGEAVAFLGDTYFDEDEMRFATRGMFRHAAVGNTFPNPDCEWLPYSAPSWRENCGKPSNRQTDYVMVSTNRLVSVSGAITYTRWSDHLPVRGTAAFS